MWTNRPSFSITSCSISLAKSFLLMMKMFAVYFISCEISSLFFNHFMLLETRYIFYRIKLFFLSKILPANFRNVVDSSLQRRLMFLVTLFCRQYFSCVTHNTGAH